MVNINSLVVFVIFALLLTAFAPSFYTSTDMRSCTQLGIDNLTSCPLENVSTATQSSFNILNILYPLIGVLGALAVMGIKVTKGKS